MTRKTIYPIFLPHAGCPFQCVYCDQKAVAAGCREGFAGTLIDRFELQFATLLERVGKASPPGEIAFYGGTFTALASKELRRILDIVSAWVERGVFSGIRFSTRPDCLGREVCSVLADYPVRTVELGVQSLCDEVLADSRRGYSAEQVREAAETVKNSGWQLGMQLMPGLPGDSRPRFLDSVRRTMELEPDFVRLYPTLVLNRTVLADWFATGIYRPLSLEEAVEWCAAAYELFVAAGIAVIRMGLHADPALAKSETVVAGPYHPAFGHLVKVCWWRRQVDRRLTAFCQLEDRTLHLRVPQRFISEVRGPRRVNIEYWLNTWRLAAVSIEAEPQWTANRLEAALR